MNIKKIVFFLSVYLSFVHSDLSAQQKDDYKYEIGAAAGIAFYMGDANKTKLYQNSRLAGGIVFRYNKDLRWAIKSNFIVGQVAGDTRKSGNSFPFGQNITFERMFYELGSQIEFNFFNYSDQYAYLGTKKISPYIFTGVGFTLGSGEKTFFDVNIPIGLGIKYKWKERVNIGFEFSFRKLFSDSFDVTQKGNGFNLDHPYNINGNILKNNDWYSLTMLSITWSFGPRVCPCLNIN